jgi:hypothetical protein
LRKADLCVAMSVSLPKEQGVREARYSEAQRAFGRGLLCLRTGLRLWPTYLIGLRFRWRLRAELPRLGQVTERRKSTVLIARIISERGLTSHAERAEPIRFVGSYVVCLTCTMSMSYTFEPSISCQATIRSWALS